MRGARLATHWIWGGQPLRFEAVVYHNVNCELLAADFAQIWIKYDGDEFSPSTEMQTVIAQVWASARMNATHKKRRRVNARCR